MKNLIILVQVHIGRTRMRMPVQAHFLLERRPEQAVLYLADVISSCRIYYIVMFFQISGTFQVNTPPVLLGYTWSKTYVSPKEDYCGQNLKECTFLNIFATIEPQISYVTCNPELDKVGFALNCFYRYY